MKELDEIKLRLRKFADERDWNQFHSPKNLSMALVVEAGELVEQFQWMKQQDSFDLSPDKRRAVEEELADVFVYLVRIADQLDIDLIQAAMKKIESNESKYPAARVRGCSKKYTEYK